MSTQTPPGIRVDRLHIEVDDPDIKLGQSVPLVRDVSFTVGAGSRVSPDRAKA